MNFLSFIEFTIIYCCEFCRFCINAFALKKSNRLLFLSVVVAFCPMRLFTVCYETPSYYVVCFLLRSVEGFDYGGRREGEVDVGHEAVLQTYAQAAVARAANGQQFAFYPAVVVWYAHATAYDAAEVVVAGGVKCHALLCGGGGYEVVHLGVAYYHRLTIRLSLYVEIFDADVAAHYRVDVAYGVIDKKYVGDCG